MDDQNPQSQNPSPPPSGDPRQQIAERLKQASNVLVTVSSNPSVDQLAACIGLTLILNKLSKHATAVFSGEVPSTIEFLQPEQTLEKNTDSLRDFIIALDKAKADKLRYKVEDKVVKIFITPYRTSIGEKDLEFSQGDFNVDVVVALGVQEQVDLDKAITAHGRILHDATVTTISTDTPSTLGTINWQEAGASSLSEVITLLNDDLGQNLLDGQIATALLTGIVAETERFSNEKTSPQTMSASATLMSAGANQQLVATKLEPPEPPTDPVPPSDKPPTSQPPAGFTTSASSTEPESKPPNDTLEIAHSQKNDKADTSAENETPESSSDWLQKQQQIHIDNEGMLHKLSAERDEQPYMSPGGPTTNTPASVEPPNPRIVLEPPSLGGTLTANSQPEGLDPSTEDLSLPKVDPPILDHTSSTLPNEPPATLPSLPPEPPESDETLGQIEQSIDSPHVHEVDGQPRAIYTPEPPAAPPGLPNLDNIRNDVDNAASVSEPLPTPMAFNSQMVADNINPGVAASPAGPTDPLPALQPLSPAPTPLSPLPGSTPPASDNAPTMSLPSNFPPSLVQTQAPDPSPFTDAPTSTPSAPPPVPPPFFSPPPASS